MPTPTEVQADVRADRRQQVAVLTREGFSLKQIAVMLNTTPRTVGRDRLALGIARSSAKPWTEAEHCRAQELLADGGSLNEVARTLNRNVSTLARRFNGQGWTAEQTGQYNALRKWEKRVFG